MCVVGSQVVTTSAKEFYECSFGSIFLAFFNCVRTAHNPKVIGSNPAAAIRPISAVFRQIPDLQRFLFISICSCNCIFAVQSAENAVEIPKTSHGNFTQK